MSDMRNVIILVLIFLGWTTSTARAGTEVGVIVAGDGRLIPVASAELKDWLEHHGYGLVNVPVPADVVPKMADCLAIATPGCMRNIVDTEAKSNTVLYAQIDEDDRGPLEFRLTLYWLTKKQLEVSYSSVCERCTTAQLKSTLDDSLAKLVAKLATGHVRIRSTPPGAHIKVDGVALAIAPLDWDLAPGNHTIEVELDDHLPQKRIITVQAGKAADVEVVLPDSTGHDRDHVWWRSHSVPLIAMTAGGAALVGGGVLIAIDQMPGGPRPPQIRSTFRFGVALSVAGAIATGLGTYLWFQRPEVRSSPVAYVCPGTAFVGWFARF